MASGIITLTKTGSGYLSGQIVWSSQSNGTQANTSAVTAALQVQRSAKNTTTGTFRGTFTVGGTSQDFSVFTALPSYEWVTLKTVTVTVSHDATGVGSCYLYAKVNGPTGTTMEGTSVSGAQTVALDAIARFAELVSAPDFHDEENPSITYTNPAGNSVQSLEACISLDGSTDNIAYRSIEKNASSCTFVLTEAERNLLRAAVTTGNSRSVLFIVRTGIGGSVGYSSLRRTVSIINPNPVLSPSITDSNDVTAALTGDRRKLVRFCSCAAVTTGAAAVKQATLASTKVTCGNQSISGDGSISGVESGSFTFTAVDSRGNSTVQTVTVPFVEYIRLTCDLANQIPDASGNMTVKATGNYFPGSFGARNNTLRVCYRYKPMGGSYGSWQEMEADWVDHSYCAQAQVQGLDYRQAYVFQVCAQDALQTVYSPERVVQATPVFDWSKGDFSFHVPVDFHGHAIQNAVGVAPDGFGLGKAAAQYFPTSETELDLQLTMALDQLPDGSVGFFAFHDNTGAIWGGGCAIGMVCKTDNRYCTAAFYEYGQSIQLFTKTRMGGSWTPIAWINPRLAPGVEYRTTQRYMGKAVYEKLVNFGYLPDSNVKEVPITEDGLAYPIKASLLIGYQHENQGTAIGDGFPGIYAFYTSANGITVKTNANLSEYYARVHIYYTKE